MENNEKIIDLLDINGDQIYEIVQKDDNLAHWNCDMKDFKPSTILKTFKNGKYLLAKDLMKQTINVQALQNEAKEIKLKIEKKLITDLKKVEYEINNEPSHRRWQFLCPSSLDDYGLWYKMQDLIYSGNTNLAYQYLDWLWPANLLKYKALFINDFKNQLEDEWKK